MKTYTAKIWRVSIRGVPGRAIEIKICAIIPLFGHILPIMGFSNRKKSREELLPCQLSYPDSNQDKQNQNLLCYHYTKRQSPMPSRGLQRYSKPVTRQ